MCKINPVAEYMDLLTSLIGSEDSDRIIVKKIKAMRSLKNAINFFKMATRPPNTLSWLFYDERAKRDALIGYQEYLRKIGMKVPTPNKFVQRFLNGGKYPMKKK